MRRCIPLSAVILGLLALIGGCGTEKPKEVPATYQNLQAVSRAYMDYTDKQNRPPSNREELMTLLKERGDPATLLRSADDNEEFVILWNVDYRNNPNPEKGFPVIAYEKTGKNGKRHVLRVRFIVQLTDEEFKNAPFPPGYKLPG